MTGCCEYGNELSDPTKGDYQFRVKDSDPRSEAEKRTQTTSVHVSFHLESYRAVSASAVSCPRVLGVVVLCDRTK